MRKVLGLVVTASLLGACTAPLTDETGVARSAIINGDDSSAGAEDAVVLLMHATRQGIGACTATLVAPNLLLTALHCVAETAGASVCDEEGKALYGGDIGSLHDAEDMYVFVGSERPRFGREEIEPAAIGKRIFAPETDVICNSDIALIELQEPIAGATIAALRLDSPPVQDETITSVGWGVTERTASPQTRQRRADVPVVAVGPTSEDGLAAADGEFVVGESICQGDSGGPAFATSTGAILGVVSRGGNGRDSQSDPAAGCEGSRTRNLYTGVAAHRDMILSAFAEAGATPWLEGELNPTLGTFGTACESGDQCQQGVCVQTAGEGPTCNADCDVDACPSGYECTAKDDAKVCTAVANADDEDGKAGCNVGAGQGGVTSLLGGLLALALLGRRRARR